MTWRLRSSIRCCSPARPGFFLRTMAVRHCFAVRTHHWQAGHGMREGMHVCRPARRACANSCAQREPPRPPSVGEFVTSPRSFDAAQRFAQAPETSCLIAASTTCSCRCLITRNANGLVPLRWHASDHAGAATNVRLVRSLPQARLLRAINPRPAPLDKLRATGSCCTPPLPQLSHRQSRHPRETAAAAAAAMGTARLRQRAKAEAPHGGGWPTAAVPTVPALRP